MEEPDWGFETSGEAKTWLRRSLGYARAKFEALWLELIEDGVVRRAVYSELSHSDFLEEARVFAKSSSKVKRRDGRKGRPKTPKEDDYRDLTSKESLRAAAFSEYAALQADRDGDVIKLRRRLTGGRLVTAQQAARFLSSQAARILRLRELQKLSIPLFDHESSIRILPSSPLPKHTVDGLVEVVATWKRGSISTEARLMDGGRKSYSLELFAVPKASPMVGREGWITVWPESVLDEIRFIAIRLARSNSWKETDAAKFLLTGIAPQVSALSMERENSRRGIQAGFDGLPWKHPAHFRESLTIQIEPWVSPKSLSKLFMRRRRHHGGAPIGETRDQKSPDSRTMEVFLFVVKEIRKTGKRPPWLVLLEMWNSRQQDVWKYSNMQNFRTAYVRGKAGVAFLGIEHWAKLAVD